MAQRWTTEEEQLILKYVRLNPGNLQDAFNKVAEETGRTPRGVQARYYMKLKKSEVAFALLSSEGVTINNKSGNNQKPSKLWNLIIRGLTKLFKCNSND